jgi:hypothetical protein
MGMIFSTNGEDVHTGYWLESKRKETTRRIKT